jgi:hypothetical protein
MKRRDFIALLGGAAAAWPVVARAQERERVRRIGILMPLAADDREAPTRIAAFHQGLERLGWIVVATCGSSTAGVRAIRTEYANPWSNWWNSPRT